MRRNNYIVVHLLIQFLAWEHSHSYLPVAFRSARVSTGYTAATSSHRHQRRRPHHHDGSSSCSNTFLASSTSPHNPPRTYLTESSLSSTFANGASTENQRQPIPRHASSLNLGNTTNDYYNNYYYNNCVTPYQITLPQFFDARSGTTGDDLRVPLDEALALLRQAVRKIAQNGLPPGVFGRNDRNVNDEQRYLQHRVLRLQQCVSHSVDPLAWLDAQLRTRRHRPNAGSDDDAAFYLHVEKDTEIAVLGTALTLSSHRSIFEWLDRLPHESRFYGASRFDDYSDGAAAADATGTPAAGVVNSTNTSPTIGEEWKDFGSGIWMLPRCEVSVSGEPDGRTVVAVHLVVRDSDDDEEWREAALRVLDELEGITGAGTPALPPTTLPPILSRDSGYRNGDGQDVYERAFAEAAERLSDTSDPLQKVVLARKVQLRLGRGDWNALQLLRRWKYGGHEGGHLFYLNWRGAQFFGCTPERLFRVSGRTVSSEALAGTRPRGSSQEADDALFRDLISSPKDREENAITGNYVQATFQTLTDLGWIHWNESFANDRQGVDPDRLFVRRLLHLQHICQRFSATLLDDAIKTNVTRFLLEKLHPTPAVCGFPLQEAKQFIRYYESSGFDRGMYSGPIGYIGRSSSDVLVAIRSGLVPKVDADARTTVHVYSGGGILMGSTLQGEWAETNYKFGVISSMFPQSPLTLQSAPTANVAWATAFVEELIRNGITQFYVCPGSRSTPLVIAVARAVRSHVGIVTAVSVHDERAAGFRALGYARGAGRPAAVITSSGTAVTNLYPAVVEAGMDGVPMLLLTADRPYENRHTGANQAIDQVKVFSSSYVRWFRDVLPPDDQVPVSVALDDAAHAVRVSFSSRGPVHLNLQFRENLAPESGPIRNDDRGGAVVRFNGHHFTDVPGYKRWSTAGEKWMMSYMDQHVTPYSNGILEVASLIRKSRRGLIVVGNLRPSMGCTDDIDESTSHVIDAISNFAQSIGFPILAGVQAIDLRFRSTAVVPFAEHLMKNKMVMNNLKPDLVLQFGAPLVSSAIPSAIQAALRSTGETLNHVLVHPHFPGERVNPEFTVTHTLNCPVATFVSSVTKALEGRGSEHLSGSEIAPLVTLGRMLRSQMKSIVDSAAIAEGKSLLTEPELVVAVSERLAENSRAEALFLSNSMPVRDCELFLYPLGDSSHPKGSIKVGTNRGASGIDGIIASTTGFAESTKTPTTLLIGDVAALHDVSSFHGLASDSKRIVHPLTTIVVNNDGGGIFSFLPIAQYGADVSFNEFFGTPTKSFSFETGSAAFGLPVQSVGDETNFRDAIIHATESGRHSVIEARVAGRDANVRVHRKITESVDAFLREKLENSLRQNIKALRLPVKFYRGSLEMSSQGESTKTLVLLHGWMGSKNDWDPVASTLLDKLGQEWEIVSIDLPGHGSTAYLHSTEEQIVRAALRLEDDNDDDLNLESLAFSVLHTLSDHYSVQHINALAGYSLGGRVALAMKGISANSKFEEDSSARRLINDDTKLILLSANPGAKWQINASEDEGARRFKDESLASEIKAICNKAVLMPQGTSTERVLWGQFLSNWYSSPMWGNLRTKQNFPELASQRSNSMHKRGRDLAVVLRKCSPPLNTRHDWELCSPRSTLFLAGSHDSKYVEMGERWGAESGILLVKVSDAGHALLVEAPITVSNVIAEFVEQDFEVENVSMDMDSSTLVPAPSTFTGRSPRDQVSIQSSSSDSSRFRDRSSVANRFERSLGSIELESFSIDLADPQQPTSSIGGIGWGGGALPNQANAASRRMGFIIQLSSTTGLEVGVGEVSPLPKFHDETYDEARYQLLKLQKELSHRFSAPFDAASFMRLNGSMRIFIENLASQAGIESLAPSVSAGLEMALLSLASQAVSQPLHSALERHATDRSLQHQVSKTLPVNGLVIRGSHRKGWSSTNMGSQKYPSVKVKVGHQELEEDIAAMSLALQHSRSYDGRPGGKVRADANRAWNESQALRFATSLDGIDLDFMKRLEFIEEPLQTNNPISLFEDIQTHLEALERWFMHSRIPYALDETLADLVRLCDHDFDRIQDRLKALFSNTTRGCAALVLKPTLIGLELSVRIANVARTELGLGVVFSSSFDSGVGLAYTSILGSISDRFKSTSPTFPHGVGTCALLTSDTLNPSFSSYVSDLGMLNVASLSRALFGLSTDDMNLVDSAVSTQEEASVLSMTREDAFEASTATSSSGKEISVVVSLYLPFSADVACSRFTDLPQHSRWSPWITSVAYQGVETEWTLNVRGIPLKWRAISELLDNPPGIQWESVSGLSNRGSVEFLRETDTSCHMKVQMTILTPRLMRPLFQGTSLFLEDFLRDKLLKWSLEMFRDVVKADLALERGDVELGDALYSAVENKVHVIEATLNGGSPPQINGDTTSQSVVSQ